jgi:hypothetical protein
MLFVVRKLVTLLDLNGEPFTRYPVQCWDAWGIPTVGFRGLVDYPRV